MFEQFQSFEKWGKEGLSSSQNLQISWTLHLKELPYVFLFYLHAHMVGHFSFILIEEQQHHIRRWAPVRHLHRCPSVFTARTSEMLYKVDLTAPKHSTQQLSGGGKQTSVNERAWQHDHAQEVQNKHLLKCTVN